jgi:hypothetical protein
VRTGSTKGGDQGGDITATDPAGRKVVVQCKRCERSRNSALTLAGVRSPRTGRKPAHSIRIDRDYEALRISMQELFRNVGIETLAPR